MKTVCVIILFVSFFVINAETNCKIRASELTDNLKKFNLHVESQIKNGKKINPGDIFEKFKNNIGKDIQIEDLKSCFLSNGNIAKDVNPVLHIDTMESFDAISDILKMIDTKVVESNTNISTLQNLFKDSQTKSAVDICKENIEMIKNLNANLYTMCGILLSKPQT